MMCIAAIVDGRYRRGVLVTVFCSSDNKGQVVWQKVTSLGS